MWPLASVTQVMVVLNCKPNEQYGGVRVNGKFNFCADLMKVVVSPLQTSVGNQIDVLAQAVDLEGDPIEYLWTGTGGSFADPSAPETTYTCEEVGDQTITITVSDDGFKYCDCSWTVDVRCVDGTGAGGTGGMGAAGGAGGAGGSGGTAGAGGVGGTGGTAGVGGSGGEGGGTAASAVEAAPAAPVVRVAAAAPVVPAARRRGWFGRQWRHWWFGRLRSERGCTVAGMANRDCTGTIPAGSSRSVSTEPVKRRPWSS